ncbi:hypothetical protein C2S52_001835 [Perilla frutescens var. hirtella]|nr:hypothetical protein C2S52_001835 [Perilla frutescens var. hirtella]
MGVHHSLDSFMINQYKVRMWDCPGDRTRRRDPNRYVYRPERCPKFWTGCPEGDACELAHGDYEFWFHPQYYRVYPCIFAPNCPTTICPYFHTYQESRSPFILNQPATVPHHNSVLQGSSSSTNQQPRLADHDSVLQGSSLSVAYSNQRLADYSSVLQGSSSSVACSNQQPRFSYDHDFPELKSPPLRKKKTPSRPPRPPMTQQPNSQSLTYPPPPPPPPRPGLGPIARPRRTNIGEQQQQPQSVLVPLLPTDVSRAFPHLLADAASSEEARSKRKHDHEAGSSNS